MNEQPIRRIVVRVPEPLYKQFRHATVDARMSLNQAVIEAVTEWLDRAERKEQGK